MPRLLCLLLIASCAEHGESPTSCGPDLELVGSPGSIESVRVALTAGETRELCLLLDARANQEPVTLVAERPGDEHVLQLALRGVEGTELAVDDGRDALAFEFPAGSRQFCWLEVMLAPGFSSGGGELSVSFVEMPR